MSWWHLRYATAIINSGGVIAHATEGVWGLACDPDNVEAVARLLALKGRSVSQGLILIGHRPRVFAEELANLSEADNAIALAGWPGPNTYVLPNLGQAPWAHWITGDHHGVAVRIPGHDQARALCAEVGRPLVSTSANPSRRKAAVTELKVRAYFGQDVDYYLPGTVNEPGAASAIHDFLTGTQLRSRAIAGAPAPNAKRSA